jgi:iron complex outermembrane recepter protein
LQVVPHHSYILFLLLLAVVLPAQDRALADASLEDLLNVSVESVSRREDSLMRTAAGVWVITAEEIRRSGAHSLAEALRLAPGLQVAQLDSYNYAISSRSSLSRFGNGILLLIDGRNTYQQIFGGSFWGLTEVALPDIDRIEVIRGSGGAMWGVNAITAVINVITRHSSLSQGSLLQVSTAADAPGQLLYRYGFRPAKKLTLRLHGKLDRFGNSRLANGDAAGDYFRREAAGLRADWDISERDTMRITAEGTNSRIRQYSDLSVWYRSRAAGPFASNGVADGASIMGKWTRRFRNGGESNLNVWIGSYAQQEELGRGSLRNSEVEWTLQQPLSRRHTLLAGASYFDFCDSLRIFELEDIGSGRRGSPRSGLASAFLQDRLEFFGDKLQLEGGIRLMQHSITGFDVQPRASLLFAPSKRMSLWASASRSLRMPARFEYIPGPFVADQAEPPLTINGYLSVPGPVLGNEYMNAWEGGWRLQARKQWSADFSVFRNDHSNLLGPQVRGFGFCQGSANRPCLTLALDRVNGMSMSHWGFDFTGQWRANARLSLLASWSRLRLGRAEAPGFYNDVFVAGSPWQDFGQFRLRSQPFRHWELDAQWFHFGRRPHTNQPAWNRVELRLGRNVNEALQLSAGVRNLLDNNIMHREGGTIDAVSALYRRRALWFQAQWTF